MSALRLTAAIRLRMLNCLQRLILILPFNASHADSFTSCIAPVETSTAPYWGVRNARRISSAQKPPHLCSAACLDSLILTYPPSSVNREALTEFFHLYRNSFNFCTFFSSNFSSFSIRLRISRSTWSDCFKCFVASRIPILLPVIIISAMWEAELSVIV